MNTVFHPSVASSEHLSSAAQARGWRLDARRAMTLRPHVPSRLQINQGRVWVTMGQPHKGSGNESGDLVLAAGESLVVPAGARLVMEPWQPAEGPVRFDWHVEPLAATSAGEFRHEVVAPSRDLALALGQAGGAFARLLRGLWAYGEHRVAGRGRGLAPSAPNCR